MKKGVPMNRVGNSASVLAVVALLSVMVVSGCGTDDPRGDFPSGNGMPTTEIVNPRLSGGEAVYNLLVSWRGYDEDGTLSGFEIAIDDTSDWTFTTAFDSQFVFESRECCVLDTTVFEDGTIVFDSLAFGAHTLFVRAVDNNGAEDPTPDHITFTATNIFPETVIERGPSQLRPADKSATAVVFEWEGRDPDGIVSAYRYKLDDKPWVSVDADCTLARFTNLAVGEFPNDARAFHRFTVISIDNAGAEERTIDPQDNTRFWESVVAIRGSLRIDSSVMGPRSGVSTEEGEIFAGTRVTFTWRGDASRYGGEIQCYQHAFDQREVFSACDLDATRYPPDRVDFVPPIGAHTLFVRTFDDAGQVLEATFPFVVLRGPKDNDIPRVLYIDDFREGSNSPGDVFPQDPDEDAFWDSVLVGYRRTPSWDAELQRDVPPGRLLGQSTTLIWYLDAGSTALATSNDEARFENPIGPYLNAGGNVILCGMLTLDNFTLDNFFDLIEIRNGCTHDPRNTYAGADQSLHWFPAFCDTGLHFVYDSFKVDKSFRLDPNRGTMGRAKSLNPVVPDFPELQSLPDLALDISKRGVRLGDQPFFAVRGLEDVEQYDPRQVTGDDTDKVYALWNYVTFDGLERKPCGLYIPASARTGRGHILILGFPPYYFNTIEMQDVFRTFLDHFCEERDGIKHGTRCPR